MNGIEAIAAERQRQIEKEGWTPEHDDEHDLFELARAGACYALTAAGYPPDHEIIQKLWPFEKAWLKPSDTRRRDLVKGAALMLADIERLDRAVSGEKCNETWEAVIRPRDDRGICPDCQGSGESGPDQVCQTCNGSGAER